MTNLFPKGMQVEALCGKTWTELDFCFFEFSKPEMLQEIFFLFFLEGGVSVYGV